MAWPSLLTWILCAPVSFALGASVSWLGVTIALRRYRKSVGESWVEQARCAYPARRRVVFDALYLPFAVGSFAYVRMVPTLGPYSVLFAVWSGLFALLGSLVIAQRLEDRLIPASDEGRFGVSLRSVFTLPPLLIYGVAFAFMPERWGWTAGIVLAIAALALTFQIAGGWLLVLRYFGYVRQAPPRLLELVDQVSAKMGVHPRSTLVLKATQANAMAIGLPKILVFTDPILEILNDEELSSVIAHEIGHLTESKAILAARMFFAYSALLLIASIPLAVSFGMQWTLILWGIVVGIVIVYQRVARRMEERSDKLGKEMQGAVEGTYARTLERLYQANLLPVVMPKKRMVHPHLYDRLVAAGVTPDYPRPEPPRRDLLAALPCILVVTTLVWFLFSDIRAREVSRNEGSRRAIVVDPPSD